MATKYIRGACKCCCPVGKVVDRWQNITQVRAASNDPDETDTSAPYARTDNGDLTSCPGPMVGLCGTWLAGGDLNGVSEQEIKDTVDDIIACGTPDSTHATVDHNCYAKSTLTAGAFVPGSFYKIVTTGSTDFTLIGAADSNPGTTFTATGVGTGTGTAILSVDMAALRFGGQWILAIKFWHGVFNWLSKDDACRTADPTAAADQTRYLTCSTIAALTSHQVVIEGGSTLTTDTTSSASGGLSVNRTSGIITNSLRTFETTNQVTSGESSSYLDWSVANGAFSLDDNGTIISSGDSDGSTAVDLCCGFDAHCSHPLVPENDGNGTNLGIGESLNFRDWVDYWNSTIAPSEPLPAVTDDDSYSGDATYDSGVFTTTIHIEWSRVETAYYALFTLDKVDDTTPAQLINYSFDVTISLSSPYTSTDLLDDFKAAVNSWKMSDFNLAKLRTDEALALAPLVVFDEVQSAVTPYGFQPVTMDDYRSAQRGDSTWVPMTWEDPNNYIWKSSDGGFTTFPDVAGGNTITTPMRTGEIIAHTTAGSERHFWFDYQKMKRQLSDDETYYQWLADSHGGLSDTRIAETAKRWMNNQDAQYDGNSHGAPSTMGNFPQAFINQFGGKMIGGKFVQAAQSWLAANFGWPCGPGKFSIDQRTVCCVNVNADPVFTVQATGEAIVPLATDPVTGETGLKVGDYIVVGGDSNYRVITAVAATTPAGDLAAQWLVTVDVTPLDDLPTGFDALGSPNLGRLRFPSVSGICGRAAITVAWSDPTLTITASPSLPYLRLDPVTGNISVDIYDASMTKLNVSAVNLTRTDDAHFTCDTDYSTAVWMTGAGVNYLDYTTASQRTGVHFDYTFDQRSTALDTGSQPAWYGGSGAGTGTGIAGCTGCTKTQFNYSYGACPAMIGIVPGGTAGENFGTQNLFDFPSTFTCDEIYGGHWQAAVMLTMPDPFWQRPFKPDCDGTEFAVTGFSWTEDDGSGHGNTDDVKYFAHHPLVEALMTIPTGKSLPAGISLAYAGIVAPPLYPHGFTVDATCVGECSPGDIATDWGFTILACADIAGSGPFSDVYATFVTCP